jgi:pantoate--beta-alanine ligase
MIVTEKISEIRSVRWQDQISTWGLVPTMGALHTGHINILRRARRENDRIGVSIFINPIQFDNPADLATYPQSLEKDLEILTEENVDLVWAPDANDIYHPGFQTYLDVEKLSKPFEGAARKGHFKGVTTIVAILFNVFQPQRAYFGEKDAQQLRIIRQMINDLKFNLQIVACPTVRERDGLAVSSRNRNLSSKGRKEAVCLFQALMIAKEAVKKGERTAVALKKLMGDVISSYSLARIDYISIADSQTLNEINIIESQCLILLAVFVENVRLIDNITIG